MLQVLSYQIADSIDTKLFRAAYKDGLYYYDADELFYKTGPEAFVYVFKYGVVCFLNYDEAGTQEFLQRISPYCKNLLEQNLSEKFQVGAHAPANKFCFNKNESVLHVLQNLTLNFLDL